MNRLFSAYEGSPMRLQVKLSNGPDAPKNSDRPPRRGTDVPIVLLDNERDGAVAVYIDELVDAIDELSIEGLTVEYEQPLSLPTTPGAVIEALLRDGKSIRFMRSGGNYGARWVSTLDAITRTDEELSAWFRLNGTPDTFTIISL